MTSDELLQERENDPRRWILVVIAVFVTAAVLALFKLFEISDEGNRVAGNPTNISKTGAISKLAHIVNEPAKANLVGREVALDAAPVESVVGDYTFWIGNDASGRMPVVLLGELTERQKESATEVAKRQNVRVFGVVRELNEVSAIDVPGYIDEKEKLALKQARYYISALRVDVPE